MLRRVLKIEHNRNASATLHVLQRGFKKTNTCETAFELLLQREFEQLQLTAIGQHTAVSGRKKAKKNGASDRIRTGDSHVGNVILYQLSYTRSLAYS